MGLKHDKVKALVQELAAEFVERESDKTSLITVTRADISKDFRKSTIFITVYPDKSEESALNFLKRKRSLFREKIIKNTGLRIIPFFDFEIDEGEKSRQRLDELGK